MNTDHSNVVKLRERTLANVLLEIQSAQRAFRGSWFTDEEGPCLDRLDALQAEARAMVESLTGVSWDAIQGANL